MRAGILVCAIVLGACSSSARDEPTEEGGADLEGVSLHTIYVDPSGVADVRAVASLDAATASNLSRRVSRAYAYDRALSAWTRPDPLAARISVDVIPDATMTARWPGFAAFASGTSDIVVRQDVATDPAAHDGVLAHELMHLQHARAGGRLPKFVEEGNAQSVQRRYTTALNEADDRMAAEATFLASIDGARAAHVVAHFRTQADQRAVVAAHELVDDESIGCLFVEFLRTHLFTTGLPDVTARLARVVEGLPRALEVDAPGYANAYDSLFSTWFSVSATEAEARFVEYVRSTERDPARRLARTVFEPYAPRR